MTIQHKCLIFAHRGANREFAENTRSAFDRALKYNIDGIETDIQLSRDGIAVLWHDRFLGKIGYPTKRIEDFDYRDLREMNFAAHFSPDAAFDPAMSLEKFLLAYSKRCQLLLELKCREGDKQLKWQAMVNATLRLAGREDGAGIMISSFHLPSLVFANETNPGFSLIYNCEAGQSEVDIREVLETNTFLYGFCLHKNSLNQALIKLLRKQGKRIAVYTCNTEADIRKALVNDIDIIISDVPEKALALRNQY